MMTTSRKPLTEVMDRQPPFDAQAEIGVLGSLMLVQNLIDEVVPKLQREDFYDHAHSKLFRHMVAMHDAGRKIDPTLLVDQLKSAGDFEAIGGAAYLSKVVNAVPNAAHAIFYADIVREKAEKRRHIETFTIGLRDCYDDQVKSDEITAATESRLLSARRAGGAARSFGEVTNEVLGELDREIRPRAAFGLPLLDDKIGPLMPGELIVIAARPRCGKTAIAGQIALHNASKGRPILIVSLEMRDRELVTRILCSESDVDSRRFRSGQLGPKDRKRLADSAIKVGQLPAYISSPSWATMQDTRAIARRTNRTAGLALLVVDYIGYVRPTADERKLPRREQVAQVTFGLKTLAKELDIPVLALNQLNRDAEENKPTLANLSESSASSRTLTSCSCCTARRNRQTLIGGHVR